VAAQHRVSAVDTTGVAVIGSATAERDDMAAALRSIGYQPHSISIDERGTGRGVGEIDRAVRALQGCVVAVIASRRPCESGRMAQALCDLAGVPCVGGPPTGLANDAWAIRLAAQALGLRVVQSILVTRENADHVGGLLAADLPLVVRPVAASPRHGATLAGTRDELVAALESAFTVDDRVLVDEALPGRELDVAVLGRPGGQRIVAAAPAELADRQVKELEVAAVTMYDAIACAGPVRIRFVLADAGPVLGEVDAGGGLARSSPVAQTFATAGVGYENLLDMLVMDSRHAAGRSLAVVG
jgi:D-alanine-D-alanine ligase